VIGAGRASIAVAGAVVPPAVVILGVVEPVKLVGVVVEAVGGRLGRVVVLTVIARRCLLLGALADDVKLLARQLHDLSSVSARSVLILSTGGVVGQHDGSIFSRRRSHRRRQVPGVRCRCSDMGNERDRLVGYCSRLVSGLVASGVVAATLHADVAALAIVAAVTLVVLAMTGLVLRDGDL
jgi:hypothetical protein